MRRRCWVGSLTAFLFVLSTIACGTRGDSPEDRSSSAPSKPNDVGRPVAVTEAHPRVVVLGDSLTAGLGLSLKDAYPTRLQERINDDNLQYTIVNAGVSGDTSAGRLSRLDWALDGDVRVPILALGGNDGLRGLPPSERSRNLTTIIDRPQARGISVVPAEMEAPPNSGFQYVAEFHRVYPTLAKKYGLAL